MYYDATRIRIFAVMKVVVIGALTGLPGVSAEQSTILSFLEESDGETTKYPERKKPDGDMPKLGASCRPPVKAYRKSSYCTKELDPNRFRCLEG